MSDSLKTIDIFLRRACRRAHDTLVPLEDNGRLATSIVAAEPSSSPLDANEQAARFMEVLRKLNSEYINKELDKAEILASSSSVQADPGTVITAGLSLAIVIFSLRFSKIHFSKDELVVTAQDTKETNENFRQIFNFLSKVLSLKSVDSRTSSYKNDNCS